MHGRGWVGAAVALLGSVALVACFDLLHSTSDVRTACELDASRPGCGAEAAAPTGDTDFCAWTSDQARQNADHACAWLGACESPMGNNAFGPCEFRALMAYDCSANPNHRAHNEAHRLWDCLRLAESCRDVDTCIFRDASSPSCSSGVTTTCGSAPKETDVRISCGDSDAGPSPRRGAENCALWGQTCAASAAGSVCAGEQGGGCDASECVVAPEGKRTTLLRWCAPGNDGGLPVDLGIDCATNGAMECGGFPSSASPEWVACKAESDAGDAAHCEPDATASCANGRARSCPAGIVEELNCGALLSSPSACASGALAPPFDWTSPCVVGTGECAPDSCNGTMLTSCERGADFVVSCDHQGLGDCHLSTGDPTSPPRAACAPAR